jgi:uncharacterized repeat protein (TIGR03806 family)
MTTMVQARTATMIALAMCGPMMVAASVASGPIARASGVADSPDPERRVLWTGSKISGTPDAPPPYTAQVAFPHLKFEFPVVLANARGTGRLFVGELRGRIYSFPEDAGCKQADLVVDLSKVHPDLTAFYGLTFHPRFDKTGYVYVCYVRKNEAPDGTVVSRFTVSRAEPPVIDPSSEKVILNFFSGGHNGGCLQFGNDGYLHISTGDASVPSPPDVMMTGQDCSDLLSSVLRIDVDRAEPGRAYGIPPDNPFVNQSGVRPEIWAFGFRNPWKMSFDRFTGDLWVGDVGWELWELVFKVRRGGNYGWSVMEGPQPVNALARRGPGPISAPIKAHPHSEAASMTGGYVYHGTRLRELSGAYIYGDFQSGAVWGLRVREDVITWQGVLAQTPLHLVAFGETNAGELYLLDYDRTHQIYRLVPNPATKNAHDFPRQLSQTGLFAAAREHRLAPGVIAYSVNSPLWADGRSADRFLAVPGDGRIGLDAQGGWRFPEGSVLGRTVSIEQGGEKGKSLRRMETQILHQEAGAWRPYSYFWNDEQTDAVLVDAAGDTRTVSWSNSRDRRELSYRVPARTECALCHNPWVEKGTTVFGVQSASPLGVNTPQLNRSSAESAAAGNQLVRWQQMGLLERTRDPKTLPRMVDPDDSSADLDRRARSYLHANCAHCHQANAGGTANIALGYELPLERTRTIGERPIQGGFQIAGAQIIAPGDPAGSVLYYRMCTLGAGRMPRLGSGVVDERATRLIYDWIAAMPPAKATTIDTRSSKIAIGEQEAIESVRHADRLATADRAKAIGRLASTTRGALMALAMIDRQPQTVGVRDEVVAIMGKSAMVEVRDLFERFVPERERVKRLGDAVDRTAILALRGDPGQGRSIFTSSTGAQCKSCHKSGDAGESVGPDLSKIGAKYDRAALLDQILEPSKMIDPQYAAYLIETKDGRVFSGLAVERTKDRVVLRDAQGQTIAIANADIDRFVPQARSLMPERLLRDLTAQQVADLLEFLASLR